MVRHRRSSVYNCRVFKCHEKGQPMSYSWIDFAGNVGVFFLLLAYLLLQINKISSHQLSYSLLNAAGASLILFSLAFDFNLSAFLIEFFWLLISLVGIYNYYRTDKASAVQELNDPSKKVTQTRAKVDV